MFLRSQINTTWLLLVCLLLISLTTTGILAAENLLTNPGFEAGNTSGWKTWGGCAMKAVQDPVYAGNYSGRIYNRTQTWQGHVHSLVGVMEQGKTYAISAWIKLDNASSARVTATVMQMDDRDIRYIDIGSATVTDDQWTQISGEFTLDIRGILDDIDVYFQGPAPGVNFYLDDAVVMDLTPEPEEPNDTPEPVAADANGVVDVNTVYQTLEGFGASVAYYENWLTAHPKKNEIYDILFKELGLDIYRIRNTYRIDTDYIRDSARIITAAESSLGHPIQVMISSWSPPASLKSNNSRVRGTLARYPGGGYMYMEFADWWADSLEEYARQGIDVNYVNIQNEPDWETDWDTCRFTPTETNEYAGYNQAFDAVYQELNARMGTLPKLLAPESFGAYHSQAYIDALIDINQVYGFAHHHYSDGDYDNPDSFIPIMQNFAANYGYKPLFQTEYSRGSGEEPYSVAMDLARHMHNSLVHEGTCSFMYWDLVWGDHGALVTLDNPWQGNPGYTINHVYYVFKHYSAFTDPGWYRVEASTDSNSLRISAFKSPDDTQLAVVIINDANNDIDLNLSIEDFSPIISSDIYNTSETEYYAYVGAYDESESIALDPQSITTVYLSLTDSPINDPNEGLEEEPEVR